MNTSHVKLHKFMEFVTEDVSAELSK